jgi:hypothetical protein
MRLDEAEQTASYEALGAGRKCNTAFHVQWELTTRRSENDDRDSLSGIDHVGLGGTRRD